MWLCLVILNGGGGIDYPHPLQMLSGNKMFHARQRLATLLDALEATRPGARERAASDLAQHEGSAAIYFPSPADRRNLSFWIWINDCDEMSITFADGHTHGSVSSALSSETPDDSILSIARGILDSRFVVAIDADGKHTGFSTVVWIDDPTAVSELFTQSWSPSTVHLRSWDGSIDTTITSNSPPIIKTLQTDEPKPKKPG